MSIRAAQHEAPLSGGIAARRIACVNESDAEVPVYSIVAATGGYTKPHASSTREYMQIDHPTGSDDALFVTMGAKMASDSAPYGSAISKYGHCWSVLSGPLWINYEGDTPSLGDIVGPKADSFKVSSEGSGFKVLQVDAVKERVRAVFLGGSGGGGNWIVEIDEVLDGCGCMVATATVIRAPCGKASRVGEEITIYDDLGCDLATHPADEWVGVKAVVSETVGSLDAYEDSPLPEDCDPDDNPYTPTDWEACHFSIVRVCCP